MLFAEYLKMFECEPRTLIWSKQPKRSYKRILSAQGTFSKRFSSAGFMFFSLSSFFTKQQWRLKESTTRQKHEELQKQLTSSESSLG